MKAPDFQYLRPQSLGEALGFMRAHPHDAMPLAGGQSLMPALNMRLFSPKVLVDIGALGELQGIGEVDGQIRIGAATRYCEIMRSTLVARHLPLVVEALQWVGHVAIRNRGTLGGSLAQADPAAELPACAVALQARITLADTQGTRSVPAAEFFLGTMSTALQPGELITEVLFPYPKPGSVSAMSELSRRHGDFALAGVAATAWFDGAKLADIGLSYFGCTTAARPAQAVRRWLIGRQLPLEDFSGLDAALDQDVDPTDSPGCSAQTRRHYAQVLTGRILETLHSRDAESKARSHG